MRARRFVARWRYTITLAVVLLVLAPLIARAITRAHDCTERGGVWTRYHGCVSQLDEPAR